MVGWDPVESMNITSDYGIGDAEVFKFIQCVDRLDPHIHEVWTFGEDGVTPEVDPIARVDIGAGVVGELATDYLTSSWRRIPMFGNFSINRSVEWLGITDFHRTNGPPWTANILSPSPSWETGGSTTNPNWGSQYGRASESVSVP